MKMQTRTAGPGAGIAASKEETKQRLRSLGLRPTKQRMRLCALLAELGFQHLSATQVHQWMRDKGGHVSLATVYNNLNEFAEVGILRRISWQGNQTLFDTNTTPHHHIIDADSGEILDTDAIDYVLTDKFPAHLGSEIACVEITVMLRSATKR